MNFKRIMSSILGLPLVAFILIYDNKYFLNISFGIIAIIAINEYFSAFSQKAKPIKWLGYLCAISIGFMHLIPKEYIIYAIASSLPIILVILFIQVIITNMKTTVEDAMITFFGICYVIVFIMFIPLIRGLKHGGLIVWYPIITAWGTDVCAFVVGKTIGKHKFSKISPNKTIEGCIGGTIGAVILSLIFTFILNTYFQLNYSYILIALISIVLSLIGQIGDFAASSIKRCVGIKDFSDLIPGHGGMLDRIDSIIFIAPFAYLIFSIL